MYKKGMIFLALTLCLLFLLTGCGGSGLTLEDYNRLEIGMSHSAAMRIVGSDNATRASESGTGQFHTVLYTVQGSGSVGANAILTFQGSPLTLQSKAQAGLR